MVYSVYILVLGMTKIILRILLHAYINLKGCRFHFNFTFTLHSMVSLSMNALV